MRNSLKQYELNGGKCLPLTRYAARTNNQSIVHAADCVISFYQTLPANPNDYVIMLFRTVDATNKMYLSLQSGGTSLRLYKMVAGASTEIADFSTPNLVSGVKVAVAMDGSNYRIYTNGVLRSSVTDSANQSGVNGSLEITAAQGAAGTVTNLWVWDLSCERFAVAA